MSSRDVLEFATLQGAKACGLDHKTGSLTPGKEADIVLIDPNAKNLFPINHPAELTWADAVARLTAAALATA